MNNRRLWGLLVVVAAISIVTASGAFSAAEVDRNATTAVVNDSKAFLGIQTDDIEQTKLDKPDAIEIGAKAEYSNRQPQAIAHVLFVYEDVRIATVENRFTGDIDPLDIAIESDDSWPVVEDATAPNSLPIAESEPITVDVKCPVVITDVDIQLLNTGGIANTVEASVFSETETTTNVDVQGDVPLENVEAKLSRKTNVRCSFHGVSLELGLDILPHTVERDILSPVRDNQILSKDGMNQSSLPPETESS
jgi:hypothetical protein